MGIKHHTILSFFKLESIVDGEPLDSISRVRFIRFITVTPLLDQEQSIYLILALLEQKKFDALLLTVAMKQSNLIILSLLS